MPDHTIPHDPIRELSIVGDSQNFHCNLISQPKVVTEIIDHVALAKKK